MKLIEAVTARQGHCVSRGKGAGRHIGSVIEAEQILVEGFLFLATLVARAAGMTKFQAVIQSVRCQMRVILAAERGLITLFPQDVDQVA